MSTPRPSRRPAARLSVGPRSVHRRPSRRSVASSAAAVLVASGLLAASALPASAALPQNGKHVAYVALGDSYAAGQGGGAWLDACHHTAAGYVDVLDARSGIDLVAEPSCAAATTADVLATQISALDKHVDLVTITIGGNDANFLGVAAACLPAPESVACVLQFQESHRILTTPGLFLSLQQTFSAIATAAPKADIVVTGYPMLFTGPAGSAGIGKAFNDSTLVLNATIAAAATTVDVFKHADISYVGAFAGHGIGSADPWIVGLEDPANALHPNARGYEAYAASIADALG